MKILTDKCNKKFKNSDVKILEKKMKKYKFLPVLAMLVLSACGG